MLDFISQLYYYQRKYRINMTSTKNPYTIFAVIVIVAILLFIVHVISFSVFVTTFFATFLAIPTALYVNSIIKRKQQKEEKEQLSLVLRETLESNLELFDKVKKDLGTLEPNNLPLNPMDLTILNSTSVRKYELLDDFSVCQAIDNARYKLIEHEEKLGIIRRIAGDASHNIEVLKIFQYIGNSCKMKNQEVKKSIENAIQKLNTLI